MNENKEFEEFFQKVKKELFPKCEREGLSKNGTECFKLFYSQYHIETLVGCSRAKSTTKYYWVRITTGYEHNRFTTEIAMSYYIEDIYEVLKSLKNCRQTIK